MPVRRQRPEAGRPPGSGLRPRRRPGGRDPSCGVEISATVSEVTVTASAAVAVPAPRAGAGRGRPPQGFTPLPADPEAAQRPSGHKTRMVPAMGARIDKTRAYEGRREAGGCRRVGRKLLTRKAATCITTPRNGKGWFEFSSGMHLDFHDVTNSVFLPQVTEWVRFRQCSMNAKMPGLPTGMHSASFVPPDGSFSPSCN